MTEDDILNHVAAFVIGTHEAEQWRPIDTAPSQVQEIAALHTGKIGEYRSILIHEDIIEGGKLLDCRLWILATGCGDGSKVEYVFGPLPLPPSEG